MPTPPTPSLGNFLAFSDHARLATFRLQRGSVELAPVGSTLRVRVSTQKKLPPYQSDIVAPHLQPAAFSATTPSGTGVQLVGETFRVQAQFEPLILNLGLLHNPVALQQLQFGLRVTEGVTFITAHLPLDPEAHIYGLGEKTGWLDKRFRRYRMRSTDVLLEKPEIGLHTDPLYASFPVFIVHSARGTYGIYVDNPEFTTFDLARAGEAEWAAPAETLTFYVLPGPTLPAVVAQYTTLTGHMPLPALWTLGYHQCRWGYASATEFTDIARELRERHFPADGMWFDIDYMNGYRVFTWDQQRFPDPGALLAHLQAQGLRAITIVDPGVKVDNDYFMYKEGRKGGHFIKHPNGKEYNGNVWPGRSAFPDFHSTKTRAWWAHHVQAWLGNYGLAGLWNDMNEPATTDLTGPVTEVLHGDGTLPHPGARNTYALNMARATYAGMLVHDPNSRPFILTRSAFSGAQTVTALWGGDNSPAWEHVAGSIPLLLNLGMSGMPFVGVDIGGFAGDTNAELLARWFQVGAFYPFCRNHAAAGTNPHEPWAFGPEIEAICRTALERRYRLLPYFYGLFREAARTGAPILRPLVWHYAKDKATFNLNDEFLLGRDVLVAPVVNPGVSARAVYLPRDTWYRWGTDEAHNGGQAILARAPLTEVPMFMRAGAMVPQWPLAPHTDAIERGRVEFHIWPGNGDYAYYEDDGVTRAFERGEYRETPFHLRKTKRGLTLTLDPASGAFTQPGAQWQVVLHAFPALAEARLNRKPLPAKRQGNTWVFPIPADGKKHKIEML